MRALGNKTLSPLANSRETLPAACFAVHGCHVAMMPAAKQQNLALRDRLLFFASSLFFPSWVVFHRLPAGHTFGLEGEIPP